MITAVFIGDLDKAELLRQLYNNAKPLGLGFLHYNPNDMDYAEAVGILEQTSSRYFDYLIGRVMKVGLSGDEMRTDLYNRDNGEGSAELIIKNIRENK